MFCLGTLLHLSLAQCTSLCPHDRKADKTLSQIHTVPVFWTPGSMSYLPRTMRFLLLALPVLALLPQVIPGNRTMGNYQNGGLAGPGLCVVILPNTTSTIFLIEAVSLTRVGQR